MLVRSTTFSSILIYERNTITSVIKNLRLRTNLSPKYLYAREKFEI